MMKDVAAYVHMPYLASLNSLCVYKSTLKTHQTSGVANDE
jgi:hypothetical protein